MSKKFKQPKPKRTIKAIDKLIKHYKRYPIDHVPLTYSTKTKEECPLCALHCVSIKGCTACPWYIIDGHGCMSGHTDYSRHITGVRLARLNRWKKKIQRSISCQLK